METLDKCIDGNSQGVSAFPQLCSTHALTGPTYVLLFQFQYLPVALVQSRSVAFLLSSSRAMNAVDG